jgi:hypothetical protein
MKKKKNYKLLQNFKLKKKRQFLFNKIFFELNNFFQPKFFFFLFQC